MPIIEISRPKIVPVERVKVRSIRETGALISVASTLSGE